METSYALLRSRNEELTLTEDEFPSSVRCNTNSNRKRKKKQFNLKMFRRTALAIAALACASSIDSAESFAGFSAPLHQTAGINTVQKQQQPHQRDLSNCQRRDSSTALMYAPSNHPTTKTAPMVAQAFYSSYKTNRNPTKPRNHQNGAPLSNSVLSSSDTLPSFPTARGLLSPETVIRMEIMTSSATRSEAVENFLRTYRRDGPMACLPMLSDPKVLPILTQAMRDIIQ
mmetsp:Transcript_6382/g.7905  ORF Transcript_6382/g.7905 Transcript_6382/m.7905 type:complete len:229 (+) Transcript_6382:156-842(+)|eukprot:CAMPEP_0203658006 /NCGR_PEP_ID=MMETSP0088-20131115/46914_1 /ASSEMBLY_ACC=CAM_ASM_001087 /TAXON_ID=426623 /ORGANISM="Chaetoceros affinis, Strain CCMP159" /LENGTH=228 /DNA_ID=CAMNT_0050519549 /DNA_START=143 /DNA_END=829 /DNA_ORIENTATION=-